MRLNRKTEYALSVILYIAYAGRSSTSINTSQIYDATLVPRKFLTVILSELQRSGILRSTRGSKGGYEIGRDVGAISLFDIVDAVMPYEKRSEVQKVGSYRDLSHLILQELNEEFIARLKSIPLSSLITRLEKMFSPMAPMFYI